MEITETEAWAAYLEVRKAKNRLAPFTPLARKRILTKLRMLAADGQNPEEILWTSVESGWTNVYPIKRKGWGPSEVPPVPSAQGWLAEHSRPAEVKDKGRISALLLKTRQKITGAF